jgi:nucleoside-diphosphate-sugar epimerase
MRLLVLGGAGFLGSAIVRRATSDGHRVHVIDGLLPETSGRREHLDGIPSLELTATRVEDCADLAGALARADVVIDAMGWTLHRAALADPLRDLALNLASHVYWLQRLPREAAPAVVYLGSRTQWGDVAGGEIAEDTPQEPADVQGIHKAAAEQHFALAARVHGLAVTTLRLPACIGPGQPFAGEDIGLVGGFVRAALAGRTIEVFGHGRRRALAFVDDVAAVVLRLAALPARGFTAYNLRGELLAIEDIARRVVALVARGAVTVAELPHELAAIDSGAAALREDRLRAALGGNVPRTAIEDALATTVDYFRRALDGARR